MNRNELAENNMKLIFKVLQDLKLYDKEDEYYDVGLIGLAQAIDKYDDRFEITFCTFAYACIKNEILKEVEKKKKRKRVPEKKYVSLDDYVEMNCYNDDLKYEDVLSIDFNLEEYIIKKEQLELMYEALNKISYKDLIFLSFYYGINGIPKMTRQKMSEMYNNSINDIENQRRSAIRKVRNLIKY